MLVIIRKVSFCVQVLGRCFRAVARRLTSEIIPALPENISPATVRHIQ